MSLFPKQVECSFNASAYQDILDNAVVTNPVCGLPSALHQMLPPNYIDSHTTQTVACHPGLQFPSSIALITHTQLQPIKHTFGSPSIVCIYHSPSDSNFTEPFHVF